MFAAGVEIGKIEEFLRHKLMSGGLRHKLTIIDPYFLSRGGFGDVQNIVGNVLWPFSSTLQFLEIVTCKGHYNKDLHTKLAAKLNYLTVRVFHEERFHDRFWIVDEQLAFVVGASINGFGKKHFFIQDDYLSAKDTNTILAMYRNASASGYE